MGDINAYALSVEFNLAGNAFEQLQKISYLTSNIEQKLQNVSKMMSSTANVGARSFEHMGTSAGKAASKVGQIAPLMTYIQGAMQAIYKANFINIADVERAQAGYERIERQLRELNALPSRSKADRKEIKQLEAAVVAYHHKKTILEKQFYDTMSAYQSKHGKFSERDLVDTKKISKFDRERRIEHDHLLRIQQSRVRLGMTEKTTEQEIVKARKATGEKDALRTIKTKYDELGKAVDMVSLALAATGPEGIAAAAVLEVAWIAVRKVMEGIEGVLGHIAPELAGATTAWGMYQLAIMGAAQRQEQFHTLNYRLVGSMKEVVAQSRDLAGKNKLLMEETDKATMALVDFGVTSADDLKKLIPYAAGLERVTGVNAQVTARFSKVLTANTKSTNLASDATVRQTRYAKAFGLTGQDLEGVMNQVADATFMMGERGSAGIEQYHKSLLRMAAGAKKMGVDVQGATGFIDQMKDPMQAAALIGGEAFDIRPAELQAAWLEKLNVEYRHIQELEKAGASQREINIAKMALGAKTGLKPFTGELDKMGKAAVAAADEGDVLGAIMKIEKEPIKAAEEMAAAIKESTSPARQLAVSIDLVKQKLQETFQDIGPKIIENFSWFLENLGSKVILTFAGIDAAIGAIRDPSIAALDLSAGYNLIKESTEALMPNLENMAGFLGANIGAQQLLNKEGEQAIRVQLGAIKTGKQVIQGLIQQAEAMRDVNETGAQKFEKQPGVTKTEEVIQSLDKNMRKLEKAGASQREIYIAKMMLEAKTGLKPGELDTMGKAAMAASPSPKGELAVEYRHIQELEKAGASQREINIAKMMLEAKTGLKPFTGELDAMGKAAMAALTPLATPRITTATGRPTENKAIDEQTALITTQNQILNNILTSLGSTDVQAIRKLLGEHLPNLGEEKASGLATYSSQWV